MSGASQRHGRSVTLQIRRTRSRIERLEERPEAAALEPVYDPGGDGIAPPKSTLKCGVTAYE
jgi:hypothetical protein